MHAKRPQPSEAPCITMPRTGQRRLLVDSYTHLGEGEIHIGGGIVELANGHRKAAFGACGPPSCKTFGVLA